MTGLAGLGLLTFIAIQLLSTRGTTEAIRDAKALTQLAGRGIAAPYLSPQLLAGQPAAIRTIDRVVHARLLADPVVRVKIWDGTGRIIYSDKPQLIGARYPLGAGELHALRTGGVDADVSDLSRPENRFERQYHKLLEVYLGLRTSDGTPVLFELYQRFSSITASGNRLFRTFFFPMIATMVLLELAQIPLAVSLARQIRQGQREREELLHRAIETSEVERRRIARDLHDGPVQDLAGVSYTLSSAVAEAKRHRPRAGKRARTNLTADPGEHPGAAHAAGRHLSAPIAQRGTGRCAVRLALRSHYSGCRSEPRRRPSAPSSAERRGGPVPRRPGVASQRARARPRQKRPRPGPYVRPSSRARGA